MRTHHCHAGTARLRGRETKAGSASCASAGGCSPKRGPYAGSQEELTPVAIDWMSFVPPTVTALWLLATPAAAHYLPQEGMGFAVADAAKHPYDQDHGRRRLSVAAINISRRLILPGVGVVVFLFAYLAQNVWQLFHIDDITRAIRNLDQAGVVTRHGDARLRRRQPSFSASTCPGTAVVIVLLLGMQPGWAQALPLVAGLMAGTLVGYGASLVLGRVLQQRLPSLVGEAYFRKVQSLDRALRFACVHPGAFHPKSAGDHFAILGYFRAERVWRYLLSWRAVAQAALVEHLCVRRRSHRGPERGVEQQFPALCRGPVFGLVAVRVVLAPHPQNVP